MCLLFQATNCHGGDMISAKSVVIDSLISATTAYKNYCRAVVGISTTTSAVSLWADSPISPVVDWRMKGSCPREIHVDLLCYSLYVMWFMLCGSVSLICMRVWFFIVTFCRFRTDNSVDFQVNEIFFEDYIFNLKYS